MRKLSVMALHHWRAFFCDGIPQEADDGIDEVTEGGVVAVVGDMFVHDAP